MITIYTDGSCLTNPGNGGWAAIINDEKEIRKISGSEKNTTNNRMELLAPINALKDMKDAFLQRRDLMLQLLSEVPGIQCNIPQGAFYIFPDVSYYFGKKADGKLIENSDDFCMYLLNTAHVALVSGAAFGTPNCVRISYAASEENLIKAGKRIKLALSKLS